MATVKLTVKRGATNRKDIAVAAGSAEAQSDTLSVNIDYTTVKRGQAIEMLDAVKAKIASAPTWPPTA